MTDEIKRPTGRFLFLALVVMIAAGTTRAGQSFLPIYQHGIGVLETDLTIGNEDDDDYTLFAPWYIDVDAGGNIFVVDSKMSHIKKFGPDGVHLRTFGRPGEGPGEIGRSVLNMVVTPSGHVIVADYENKRITEFDNRGEYVGDQKFHSMVTGIRCRSGGGFLVYTQDPDTQEFWKYNLRLAEYTAGFDHVADIDSQRVALMKQHTHENTVRMVSIPYVDRFQWELLPNGNVVISDPGDYHLRIVSPDLKTIREIERDVPRAKVTRANKDEFVKDMDEGYVDIARDMEFPRYKPYVSELLADHEGYILVCRYDEKDSDTHYDVFSPEGEFVGEVTLPRASRLRVFKLGFVYGVKTFEEELPQVRRYRLEPGSEEDLEEEDV
jgi:hypothetical protein